MSNSRINGIIKNSQRHDCLQTGLSKDHSINTTSVREALIQLAEIDPTKNKQYLNWIVDRYAENDFYYEDADRVQMVLSAFNRVFHTLEEKERNIFNYPKLSVLEDAMEKFMDGEVDDIMSNREKIRIAKQNSKKFINTKRFKVIIPECKEAAAYYGYGTRWCTNTSDEKSTIFEGYHKKGPVYIIIADDRKFQLHYESSQFANEKDDTPNEEDIKFLSQFEQYKEFLEYLIDKHYIQPIERLRERKRQASA